MSYCLGSASGIAYTFWFWIMIGLGAIWTKRHFDIWRAKRDRMLAETDAAGPDAEFPKLSVLVAGKDEEANIERCLRSLLAQDYPDWELLVINDRSDDATPAIIDRIAAEDARVRPIHIRELPPGWYGKGHAMHTGVHAATGELLCFTDADCAFDSRVLLRAAAQYYRKERVDFLSVLPLLEAGGFWERVIQPVAGGVLVYWMPPHKVNDPRSSCAYANGAFMMVSRGVYDEIGGHYAIRQYLNEDIHFAKRVKLLGKRLVVLRGPGMYRVRMYVGLRQAWRGWSRNFYGVFGSYGRLIGTALMLGVASLSPYITLLAAAMTGTWPLAAAAGFAVVAQQSVLWRYYPLAGIAAPYALTYPLGALLAFGMSFDAMTRLGRRATNWRGTAYQHGAKQVAP